MKTRPDGIHTVPEYKTIGNSTPADKLFAEFPDLTRPPGFPREVRHNTVHHIKTTPGASVSCQLRRLAPDLIAITKAEFDVMLTEVTARRSDGPWSAALHLVPKKDNGWRPCGDYRAINARTITEPYTVRHIHDNSHQLTGCTIFSTIELVRAYHLIPVHPEDVRKTTITTSSGLFEFPFMSFGLRNAAQKFQSFMDETLSGFEFCFAYVDEILVYSRIPAEHELHLRTLFKQLQAYGILLNPGK